MIRELRKVDINKVAEIWSDTNIKTHYFISAQYWKSNFELVKELLLQATVYVYEGLQTHTQARSSRTQLHDG